MYTIEMPKLGDLMQEGHLVHWLKHEGDAIHKGEAIAEIETEKAVLELEAIQSGILHKILIPEGRTVPIFTPLGFIGKEDETVSSLEDSTIGSDGQTLYDSKSDTKVVVSDSTTPPIAPQWEGLHRKKERIFISPLARKIAIAHDVPYHFIQGTGPSGRIVKQDIESYMAKNIAVRNIEQHTKGTLVDQTRNESLGDTVTPLTNIRKVIVQRTMVSLHSIPHFHVTTHADMTDFLTIHRQLKELDMKSSHKIRTSLNDMLLKAVVTALNDCPSMNVSMTEDAIVQHHALHLGFAVATEEGVMVPVLHHAERMSLATIAEETQRLIQSARERTIRIEDMHGATFSVSNLGMYGIDHFTAIIDPGEAAILSIGAIQKGITIQENVTNIRDIMSYTLNADHRLVDGALAATFLQTLTYILEHPLNMIM